MKRFTLKILLFIFIVGSIVYSYLQFSHILIERVMGPSTASLMHKSFSQAVIRKYDLVILGSSRTHAAINPDAAPLSCYNFSFEGETFNQYYYKLKYLEEKQVKPKYAIIGVEYFHFAWFLEDLNPLYKKYFPKEYYDDYRDSIFPDIIGYKNRKNTAFNQYMTKRFSNTIIPFINGGVNYLLNGEINNSIRINPNGQYISYNTPNPNDSIVYDHTKNPILEAYFYRTVNYCKNKGIKVFLVMTPALSNTLKYYPKEVTESYNHLITAQTDNKNVFFYNFSTSSNYTINDFKDASHLNVESSVKFTKELFELIQKNIQ